jgi:hypothetical protein
MFISLVSFQQSAFGYQFFGHITAPAEACGYIHGGRARLTSET